MTALEKADAETFFAEPGVRAAAVVFDFALVMFIAYQLLNEISGKLYVTDIDARLVIALALLAYFTGSWLSPMRATPVQFLFGMRVLDQSGQKLTFARALLRSVLVVAMVGGTLMLLAVPGSRFFGAVALVSFALAYLAALTPNRQAMPDLLARTVVVNRVVLKSPEKLEQLRQHVTENDPATRKLRRPTIPSMIGNAIVLAVPFLVLVTFAQVSNDMELRHRTSYAIEGTAGLRAAVREYYMDVERWPTNELEAGAAIRGEYPDGGYYELEEDGVIRIHFTKIPALKRMTIVLTPRADEESVSWHCRADGDVKQPLLVSWCRDGTERSFR